MNNPEIKRLKLVFASDHGGFELKSYLIGKLESSGYEILDLGVNCGESVDYPDMVADLVDIVLSDDAAAGVLLCGTGIGMSIAANRYKEIRAALCHNVCTAKLSREHNNANVLVLGGRVLEPETAWEMLQVWLSTPFEGGRHARRVEKLG